MAEAYPISAEHEPLGSSVSWQQGAQGAKPLVVRFSCDDSMVAAGYSDGTVRVYDARTGEPRGNLEVPRVQTDLPAPVMRFSPQQTIMQKMTRQILLVGTVDKGLQQWDLSRPTEALLYNAHPDDSIDQILALDYHPDGRLFAVAGTDKSDGGREKQGHAAVRIFDDNTKKRVMALEGHQNRITCLRYAGDDSPRGLLVSGGFDGLRIWDVREKRCAHTLMHGAAGVELCGDAVDIRGTTLLTASYRTSRQLQQWDLRTGRLLNSVPLPTPSAGDAEGQAGGRALFAAQFAKDRKHGSRLFAASGSGCWPLQIFARGAASSLATKAGVGSSLVSHVSCVATPSVMPGAIFGLDWSHEGMRLALASSTEGVVLVNLRKPSRSLGSSAAAATSSDDPASLIAAKDATADDDFAEVDDEVEAAEVRAQELRHLSGRITELLAEGEA